MATFPVLAQQELLRACADEYPGVKLRDDDFTNPQVILAVWLSSNVAVLITKLLYDVHDYTG